MPPLKLERNNSAIIILKKSQTSENLESDLPSFFKMLTLFLMGYHKNPRNKKNLLIGAMLSKTHQRRHDIQGRQYFAFSDVRRLIAKAVLYKNFIRLFPIPRKTPQNFLVSTMLRLAA